MINIHELFEWKNKKAIYVITIAQQPQQRLLSQNISMRQNQFFF